MPFVVALIFSLIFHFFLLFPSFIDKDFHISSSGRSEKTILVELKQIEIKSSKTARQQVSKPQTSNLKPQTSNLKKSYVSQIWEMIGQKQFYPIVAKRNHLEGEVSLVLSLNSQGEIIGTKVALIKGHQLFVTVPKEILKEIGSFPPFPQGLAEKRLDIKIPLRFKLAR